MVPHFHINSQNSKYKDYVRSLTLVTKFIREKSPDEIIGYWISQFTTFEDEEINFLDLKGFSITFISQNTPIF